MTADEIGQANETLREKSPLEVIICIMVLFLCKASFFLTLLHSRFERA